MVYKKTFGKVVFDIINVTVLVFIAAMCIMPILHVLFSSLSDPRALARNEGVVLWPLGEPTLKGYELVFQNPNIVQGYGNTLFYVTVGTTLGTFMTALCGYVLSRKDILYRGILTFFVTFTMMFSGGLIPFYMVVRNLGWIDKRIALIVPGISVFNVIVVRTAFMSIPDSLEESAKLDGAGHMTILFRIILPLSKAVIAVIVLFIAVFHWNSWFFAMIFLQTRTCILCSSSCVRYWSRTILRKSWLDRMPLPRWTCINRLFSTVPPSLQLFQFCVSTRLYRSTLLPAL